MDAAAILKATTESGSGSFEYGGIKVNYQDCRKPRSRNFEI
jgi:hypothetical protein